MPPIENLKMILSLTKILDFQSVTLKYSMVFIRINQIRLAFLFQAGFLSILTLILDYLVVENAIQCPVLPFFVVFYSARIPRIILIKSGCKMEIFD